MNSIFFAEAASILSDHAHFLAAKTSVLNRHAEQHVLVFLVVSGKGVGKVSWKPRKNLSGMRFCGRLGCARGVAATG